MQADLLAEATFWKPLGPFGRFPLIRLRFFFPAGIVLSHFLGGLNDTSLSVSSLSSSLLSLAVLYSSSSDEKLGSKRFSPLHVPLEVLASTLPIIGLGCAPFPLAGDPPLPERNPCSLDGHGGSHTGRPGGIDLPAPLTDGAPLPGVEPLPPSRLGFTPLGDLPLPWASPSPSWWRTTRSTTTTTR